jgi:RNA polymerase sigma factor (sigma-70 family)
MSIEEIFDSNLAHALVCARRYSSADLPLPEAEQCARIALLKAATSIRDNRVENVEAYVATCVKNEITDLLRSESRRKFTPLDETDFELSISPDISPDRAANQNDIRMALAAALDKRTPAQRLVMERTRDGSKQVDIAVELNVTPTAVRSLQKRAAKAMAEELKHRQIIGVQFSPDNGEPREIAAMPASFNAMKCTPVASPVKTGRNRKKQILLVLGWMLGILIFLWLVVILPVFLRLQ